MNSNYLVSGLFYFYKEGSRQLVNTDATFLANSTFSLTITEEATNLRIPVPNVLILKQHRTGFTNDEPVYQANPFFTSLVGSPVKVAQVNEKNRYWLLSGTISSISGTDIDDITYQLNSVSVAIVDITKPKYAAFASLNGTVWCDNGSILNLVLLLQGSSKYLDKTMINDLQKDWANTSFVNLIGNKIYLSRKTNPKDRSNFAEEWELILESNRLNFRRIQENQGDVSGVKQESIIRSVSYFPIEKQKNR